MSSTDSKASPIKKPVVKLLALLSIVRWYNILLITISLYLTELFIFNKETSLFITIQHPQIHFYTLSIVFLTMGGYLINAFYDFVCLLFLRINLHLNFLEFDEVNKKNVVEAGRDVY